MSVQPRHLRADAERNRQRLIEAAEAVFNERGLDVSVAEIAQRAGVGRGTLFRNFESKEHLIAAIVVERMTDVAARGQTLFTASDAGQALFDFLEDMVGRQRLYRALWEAIEDAWLANAEIRAAHDNVLAVLEQLLARAQKSGAVRSDVGAMDVLMMFKGVCEAQSAFSHLDPEIAERQLDLVRAALSVPAATHALRGRAPKLSDIESSPPSPDTSPSKGRGA